MKEKSIFGVQFVLFLILTLVTIGIVSAQITIDSFSTDPENVEPGEIVDLQLNLENIGDEDIENIVISIDLSSVPFAPIESSTEKAIDEINEGDEESVSFTLVALSSAEAQTYKIPISISYENTTKTSLISIEVVTDTSLDVIL